MAVEKILGVSTSCVTIFLMLGNPRPLLIGHFSGRVEIVASPLSRSESKKHVRIEAFLLYTGILSSPGENEKLLLHQGTY